MQQKKQLIKAAFLSMTWFVFVRFQIRMFFFLFRRNPLPFIWRAIFIFSFWTGFNSHH